MELHGAAAAAAAVADSKKASERCFLEKRVMAVPPFRLLNQDVDCFLSVNQPASTGMMFGNETDKRFSKNQTDIEGQTRIGPHRPAGAVQHQYLTRFIQNDIAGQRIGYYRFKIPEIDGLIQGHQMPGGIETHNLSMVGVGKGRLSRWDPAAPFVKMKTCLIYPRSVRWKAHQCVKNEIHQRVGCPDPSMFTRSESDPEVRPASVQVTVQRIDKTKMRGFASF